MQGFGASPIQLKQNRGCWSEVATAFLSSSVFFVLFVFRVPSLPVSSISFHFLLRSCRFSVSVLFLPVSALGHAVGATPFAKSRLEINI